MKVYLDILQGFNAQEFQQDLISWFEQEQRDLPWRVNKDPYRVWISEIMLQQTRVEAVKPYYKNFMEKFPTLTDLADAAEDEVLKAWEGLGYYSRARNLQAAVREVRDTYGGIVPNTPEEIGKLKGVGPYTKGAILSIAYDIPEPAVDGNVMRVMSRILSIWEDIAKPKTRQLFEDVIRQVISHDNPSYFNQGLMELGALICIPKNPSCLLCPVRQHCRAFHEGVQKELPVKSKAKEPKLVPIVAGVFRTPNGKYVVNKRPSTGLLANMWEFPNVEVKEGITNHKQQLMYHMKEQFDLHVEVGEYTLNIQHGFTHRTWDIFVFEGMVQQEVIETETLKVMSREEMEERTFSRSHQKIYEACTKK
ncbi:A/G-specific adenine glycosylase [Ectobacillus antri]|uniref:Adenine DNA glycosylase n=1 Tax=Ectobacillus antri TaxID=2486280 RepID=A0ABT6H6T0_9BACI|nr:A/G-specific adenine glycosylase [Ectobacillus antri]MDG4657219.1 A/G-specific adenine glycosylase [Ectobacillus antri]MDG5754429.1 A/G-specific adenine glycosylase [Ectobacillus antri]